MGIETEYGISSSRPPQRQCHAHLVPDRQRVRGGDARARRARWDFEEENPLRDARGFDLAREAADSSQLTDEEAIGLANVILTNGARLYVDHAHPEYSAPEVTNPWDAVLWDKAGERIMAEAAERAAQLPGAQPIHLYNNTDNKGASYGTHENYLMKRETPFSDIVRHLTPFFVSRQVVTTAASVSVRTGTSTASSSVSARTTSRSRSALDPRSTPSSTPATSRTRTPRSTAGCA